VPHDESARESEGMREREPACHRFVFRSQKGLAPLPPYRKDGRKTIRKVGGEGGSIERAALIWGAKSRGEGAGNADAFCDGRAANWLALKENGEQPSRSPS